MRYLSPALLASLVLFASCKKETPDQPAAATVANAVVPYSEASYKMTVVLNWKNPQFTVPAGVHVTALIGMIHSKDTYLWRPGLQATKGLEDVAEIGNTIHMNTELDSILALNLALTKFSITPPPVTGTVTADLNFNTNYPCISFASMIAPSPDWFMGLHDLNLFEGNKWADDLTVQIMLYDAGTEDGDVFGYNNPATVPQQNISFLTPQNASVLANGNMQISAIGTARFVKN